MKHKMISPSLLSADFGNLQRDVEMINSSAADYVNGLEVYTAKNINYDFAKLLVDNITKDTGIKYSKNRIVRKHKFIFNFFCFFDVFFFSTTN